MGLFVLRIVPRIAVAYYGSSNLAFTLVWGRGVLLYTKVVILSTITHNREARQNGNE